MLSPLSHSFEKMEPECKPATTNIALPSGKGLYLTKF